MQKLIFASIVGLLAGCASSLPELKKEDFIGEWSCQTKYENIGVGTVDLLKLNADSTMNDDNYIFDHLSNRILEKPINDYFSSPFKYLKRYEGSWVLSGRNLKYQLKAIETKRIIFADVFEGIQESDFIKKEEGKLFEIYSKERGGDIELEVVKYNSGNLSAKRAFTAIQKMGNDTYTSYCVAKDVAKFEFNQRLEIYKSMKIDYSKMMK